MRRMIGLLCAVTSLVSVQSILASDCGNRYQRPAIKMGHDSAGYFVRVDWKEERDRPRRGTPLDIVGDYMANEAGVTILYQEWLSDGPLNKGEFRGADPLTAMRAFASSIGFRVDTPSNMLWVLTAPFWDELTSTIVFARPLDPEGQGFLSKEQVGDLELALINRNYSGGIAHPDAS